MKSLKKYSLALIALFACGYAGCESDSLGEQETKPPEQSKECEKDGTCPETPDCSDACTVGEKKCSNSSEIAECKKPKNGCPEWVTKTICESGTHCDEETLECEEGCGETCSEEGETKCSEDGLFKCKTDENGCAVWKKSGSCPTGTYCNYDTGKCVEDCPDACDPEAPKKCIKAGIDICENNEKGCGIHTVKPCDVGTYCDEETITCIPCQETCNPDALTRCSDKGIETCTPDVQGCAEWTLTECPDNQICDPETLQCVDGCTDACTAGDKKCDQNGISECGDSNEDGCTEWGEPVACEAGLICDEETISCKCNDECREGENKCENNSIFKCTKNDTGCMEWSKPESCGTGKTCNKEKTACELTCGSDCEPFSIILIPDTQNYSKNYSNAPGEKNIYTRQMKWIKDNEKKENIRAAIHLGDITDNNSEPHWQIADYAHKTYLDKSTVPYSMSTGNHDYGHDCGKANGNCSRERSRIHKYFGPERFKGKDWFHTTPYTGNYYITFSVGNIKFLVLALEFAARKDVICWADEFIQKNNDYHVIIETHNYLEHEASKRLATSVFGRHGYSGPAYLPDAAHGASGYDLYHELVARHNNIIMAVSGHEGETEWRQKKAYNGNTVTEMVVDYQFEAPCHKSKTSECTSHCAHVNDAGNGWLRQLIFDPKTNKVQGKTITVLKNSEFAGKTPAFYCSELNSSRNWYPSDAKHADHQFSFDCDFTTPIDYKYSDGNYLGFTNRNINSKSDGQQLKPAIAMHRTLGTMVTVWEDDSSSEDGSGTAGIKKDQPNHDIEGRIFYGGGCQKVAQFTINANKAGDQMTPAVAMDKDGNFVVVWADDTDGNGLYEIMMRGFDENGKERIKPTLVNTKSDGQQTNPSIAMAPDGRFVVAWEDESDDAKTPQIFIRGFKADGQQAFDAKNVDTLAGVRRKPSVGIADNGNFVVTWEDDTDMNEMFQIVAKGFNADGTERLKMFTVNTLDNGQQLNPTISMNGAGVFYIAYEDDEDANGIYRIKARGYQADGKDLTADMWISDAGEDAVDPVLCVNKNNEIVYAWTAKARNSGDIRRRAYRSGKLEDNHNVNIITAGTQDQPAMACTEDGRSGLIWHDDLDQNGFYEIFGHGYNEM